jgi:AcrR family transcriptional regulator
MEPDLRTVKPRRSYDSTRRREQADRARQAVLDVALRRFLDDGYAATTIAAIAQDADVSPDTIYKSFGGKPGLVRALCERGLEGAGPVPAEQRSDALQATAADPTEITRGFGKLASEVAPRVAPLLLLLAAAGQADPQIAALRAEFDAKRLARMTHNARMLHKRGLLREDLSVKRAGEICWTYSSPELYQLLVLDLRWPLSRFGQFISDALTSALLPTGSGT